MEESGHYKAQEKVLKELLPEIAEPILDLACGTGFILSILSKLFNSLSANDLSIGMLNFTRNKLKNKILNYSNENAEELVSCARFKTIICCNLFYYLVNYNKAITKWKKLLEESGKIIIIEEHPFTIKEKMIELKNIVNPKMPEEIIQIMNENSLRLVRTEKTAIDSFHDLYGFAFVK